MEIFKLSIGSAVHSLKFHDLIRMILNRNFTSVMTGFLVQEFKCGKEADVQEVSKIIVHRRF